MAGITPDFLHSATWVKQTTLRAEGRIAREAAGDAVEEIDVT